MRGSRKFCQSHKSISFVTNINGPPSASQRNAIEMAFCWRSDDAGDPDLYCEETLHFFAFSAWGVGGGGGGWGS